MASKRNIRNRSCVGKRRYTEQHEAHQAVFYHRKKGNFMRVYKCKFCMGYHIGHTPNRIKKKIRQAQKAKKQY
jgi:hypothetical protein